VFASYRQREGTRGFSSSSQFRITEMFRPSELAMAGLVIKKRRSIGEMS